MYQRGARQVEVPSISLATTGYVGGGVGRRERRVNFHNCIYGMAMLLYCQHEMHTALELWSWLLDFL